ATNARSCKKDIETSLATLRRNWSELHTVKPSARSSRPVSNGDYDGIAFVALHIFQILYEERLRCWVSEKVIKISILPPLHLQQVVDEIALVHRERRYPQRKIRSCLDVPCDSFDYGFCLDFVGSSSATIVSSVHALDPQAHLFRFWMRARY